MEAALLLLWPALAATHLRNRPTLSAALAIIVLAAAISTPAPGALAATACAALAFGPASWNPRLTGLWLGASRRGLFRPRPARSAAARPARRGRFRAFAAQHEGLGRDDRERRRARRHRPRLQFVVRARAAICRRRRPHSMLFHVWTDLGLIGALTIAALVSLAFQAAPRNRSARRRSGSERSTYVFAMGVFGSPPPRPGGSPRWRWRSARFALVSRGDYKTARPTAPRWTLAIDHRHGL